MALTLNLEKSRAALKLSLEKKGVVTPPRMDVGFALDVSGSYEDEHRDGLTNDLLTRLVPWALTFDPDAKLDLATFSDGERGVVALPAVTAANYLGYVNRHVIDRVDGWCGGTDYRHVLAHFCASSAGCRRRRRSRASSAASSVRRRRHRWCNSASR